MANPRVLPVGKLPLEQLRSLLASPPGPDPRLLIGPRIGEDAAVIDAGDRYLVVTTDPITFATDHIGRYAVHVNGNDVAVLGARPLWFFVVMLLPESRTTPELAEAIMADVRMACEELGVALGGGHTEITQGLDRPILVGQMLGEVAPGRLVRKARIAIGDRILLTRGVAIEGTAILAREASERLQGRVDADCLAGAARLLIDPGISVVGAALAAAGVGDAVHGMHDPTEGGLATGLMELVTPAGLGLQVVHEHIPVFPETAAICEALGLDPLKLIASGALLIAVAPAGADAVLAAIQAAGIPVTPIGEVRRASDGISISTRGVVEPLTPPARDEIARALGAE
ncbi:MAG TPA: AIR synthase family protein [Vicinamibacterales bacterium]|jgi:hydrogenase maturation factor|nr:AIR synthase family protein [Vicinamibacterales bacterium]